MKSSPLRAAVTAGIAALAALSLGVSAGTTIRANLPEQTSVGDLSSQYEGDNLFLVKDSDARSRRMYVVPASNAQAKSSHILLDGALPWSFTASYTLDGPDVTAEKINGASGLVGVHVNAKTNDWIAQNVQQFASSMRLFVFFSMPAQAVSDVSADSNVAVVRDGNTIYAGASAAPGSTLDFHVYAEAKNFSMSPLVLVALPKSAASTYANELRELASQSAQLINTVTGENADDANAKLIAELTQLRDHERELADAQIKETDAAHKKAFHDYMSAYVGSYTTHLSGSVGNSTQLTALMGTAGELSGDTPVAEAVTNLASAVNARSDAYQHIGAANEVDWIIRRIRQQGTQGLTSELAQRAGTNSREGTSGYSAGQKQLSSAMIPYSMAYTDAYTANLNTLTGGDVSKAQGAAQEAIAKTDSQFDSNQTLKDDQAKVDAAMESLALAREHTGAASADRQISLRFATQFADSGENSSTNSFGATAMSEQTYRDWCAHSIGGMIEQNRDKAIAKARTDEQQKQSADGGSQDSLVVASNNDASADVNKFAGSAAAGLGVKSVGGSSSDSSSSQSSDTTSRIPESERLATQLGVSDLASNLILHANPSEILGETVQIGQAQALLEHGATMCTNGGTLAKEVDSDAANHWPDLRIVIVNQ